VIDYLRDLHALACGPVEERDRWQDPGRTQGVRGLADGGHWAGGEEEPGVGDAVSSEYQEPEAVAVQRG
jgi:hypothetical protein